MASVLCDPAGEIASAAYFRYDSVEALETALLRCWLTTARSQRAPTAPSGRPWWTTRSATSRVADWPATSTDGTAVALWTNPGLLMMAIGAEASGDFGKLFTWWQDAGPLP